MSFCYIGRTIPYTVSRLSSHQHSYSTTTCRTSPKRTSLTPAETVCSCCFLSWCFSPQETFTDAKRQLEEEEMQSRRLSKQVAEKVKMKARLVSQVLRYHTLVIRPILGGLDWISV